MIPAISLWQPWASFIAIGVKPYETRSWAPARRFIGQRIAIHAAKKMWTISDLIWWERYAGIGTELPLGVVVCTAILRAALPAESVPPDDFGDYTPGRVAWHLTDIQRCVPPVPARGAQGFWMWTPADA